MRFSILFLLFAIIASLPTPTNLLILLDKLYDMTIQEQDLTSIAGELKEYKTLKITPKFTRDISILIEEVESFGTIGSKWSVLGKIRDIREDLE